MKLDCMGQRIFSNERMEARICKSQPKTMVFDSRRGFCKARNKQKRQGGRPICSHSLNSLKGGYMGDYIGDYYRGY